MVPNSPKPALLMTTSMVPKCSFAFLIASKLCALLFTSSWRGRIDFPYSLTRSFSVSTFRAVATTLSPRFKKASAQILPNPLEAPVIKMVFAMCFCVLIMNQSYCGHGLACLYKSPEYRYGCQNLQKFPNQYFFINKGE